jgi:GMP synthase (glutamine-hydrolysing)
MMNRLLIVKVGETFPTLVARKGDFEDWVLSGMGLAWQQVDLIDPRRAPLPPRESFSGVVVTGSHDMVSDRLDWSERTGAWLVDVVEAGIPVLGICYGHQLLAQAFGGEVGDNPNGLEYGTVEARLHEVAWEDRLLGGLGASIRVQVCHRQAVLKPPREAKVLASSERDGVQALVIGQSGWGVQFHPEFDREAVIAYIDRHRDDLAAEGQDPDRLMAGCRETPVGAEILQRFVRIAGAPI